MSFQQEDFQYHSLYHENSYLEDILKHFMPSSERDSVAEDIKQFSIKTAQEIHQLMVQAEGNPPELIQYDHWGKRIDKIIVDPAWDELHKVSAREGIVAIGYERTSGEYSRLHQFIKLMLFHPSSAFYSCPLAMTDGAARVLEQTQGVFAKEAFKHLTSREIDEFWTAGQWMTEKTGGSDVSESETYAEEKGGRYFLHGTKWFTSAITANIAMTLAQTDVEGKKKLSLFLVKIRDEKGELNNIEVLRLKDKLGTKAMPTAELKLQGVEGFLIGELGSGVKNIATVLNISRLYNSVCATGTMYRLHSLIRDYSQKRKAFGKFLIDHPLHQLTLLKTQADTVGCVQMISALGLLLGLSETEKATETQSRVLRVMTPIAKLWTAKKAVSTVSELIEAFGGAGYIEDTQLPRFLRDAQVFPIWEGTTNIMSLDTLRAFSKPKVYESTMGEFTERLEKFSKLPGESYSKLVQVLRACDTWFLTHHSDPQSLELGARSFAFSLGDFYVGLLLLEFAESAGKKRDERLATTFISNITLPQFNYEKSECSEIKETLLS